MKLRLQRGWWRPWNWSTRTWLLVILASMVISPLSTRWFYLWQIPDVSVPFDVEEFVGAKVPREQDALTYYVSAARMLDQDSPDWLLAAMDHARSYDGHWDERLDQWLIDNANGLALLEFGSKREHVKKSSLDPFAYGSSLHSDLRYLMRVSETEARRHERSRNFDEAWAWHRVTLRLGNHTEKMGSFIDYLTGALIRDIALNSIVRWASHPSVTVEQLRLARKELVQLTSNRTTLSEIMKFDYLWSKNVLESAASPDYLFPELENVFAIEPISSSAKRFYSWTVGQPELALRLLRQVLNNNLNQIDQPLHLRRRIVRSRYPMLIELDPAQEKRTGQLSVIQLENALEGSSGRRLIKSRLFFLLGQDGDDHFGVDRAYRMHEAYAVMGEVVLAAQEYFRLNGEFPANLNQLVPVYLQSEPLDPMSATGASLNYHRDSVGTAKVWSRGRDGIDDGGYIEGNDATDQGYRIFSMDRAEPREEKAKPVPTDDATESSK